jgi:hypothetical protein
MSAGLHADAAPRSEVLAMAAPLNVRIIGANLPGLRGKVVARDVGC